MTREQIQKLSHAQRENLRVNSLAAVKAGKRVEQARQILATLAQMDAECVLLCQQLEALARGIKSFGLRA